MKSLNRDNIQQQGGPCSSKAKSFSKLIFITNSQRKSKRDTERYWGQEKAFNMESKVAESNPLLWEWSHIITREMGQKTLLCNITVPNWSSLLQKPMSSTHRADSDRDARLIHGADAFIMRSFNEGHLFLFFWEAGNWHSATDTGVAWHHRLSGDWLAALWIQGRGRGKRVRHTVSCSC